MELKKNPKADLEDKKGILFAIGLVLALSFVLIAFEWKTYEEAASSLGQLQMDDIEEEIIPITQQNQPPPPPPQEILEIVEDDKVIEDEVEIQDSEADMETEIFEQPEEVFEEAQIFTVVEDMPIFPGCEGAGSKAEIDACTGNEMRKFIGKNTSYPAMARDAGTSGRVYVQFLVDTKGEVNEVKVVRGVPGGKSLEKEAVRVIKALPKMKPGKQRGKPVRIQYTVPVNFKLSS
jgi:protein TonB